jgi:hypothetical protein
MRRLLVLSTLVCCVLAVPAPAQAYHLYVKLVPDKTSGTAHVYTTCPKGHTLTVTVGTVKQSVKVSSSNFRTKSLYQAARARSLATASSTGTHQTMTATCSPASGQPPHTILAFTGVTTGQKLLLAVGLLGIGVVLLMVGHWQPPRRPRRPRPPVKVYAQ